MPAWERWDRELEDRFPPPRRVLSSIAHSLATFCLCYFWLHKYCSPGCTVAHLQQVGLAGLGHWHGKWLMWIWFPPGWAVFEKQITPFHTHLFPGFLTTALFCKWWVPSSALFMSESHSAFCVSHCIECCRQCKLSAPFGELWNLLWQNCLIGIPESGILAPRMERFLCLTFPISSSAH